MTFETLMHAGLIVCPIVVVASAWFTIREARRAAAQHHN